MGATGPSYVDWVRWGEIFSAHRSPSYARLAAAEPLSVLPSDLLLVLHAVRRAAFEGRATDPWSGDVAELIADVDRLRPEVESVIERGLVQFTEPLRVTDLLPGLLMAARRYPGRPIRLIELGACAGLLLIPEAYRIHYPGITWPGDPVAGPVAELTSDLDLPPRLLDTPVDIVERVGIDLAPVDPAAPESLDYLRSFAWSDDVRREQRLAAALTAIAARPPRLMAGDIVEVLPDVLTREPDVVTVVIESATAHYLPPRSQRRLGLMLDAAATRGPVVTVTRSAVATSPVDLGWRAWSAVSVVDLTARWRRTFAVTDMLSERQAWVGEPLT